MAKVYVFLADGFEDVEALIPIDVLRRGGVEVVTVSTTDFPLVESAHGVNIEADLQFEQCDFSDADLLMLPGGMPGAANLYSHEGVCKAVCDQAAAGKKIAAICAAPAVVLAQLGLLEGKKATCYPGFEQVLKDAGAQYTGDLVTVNDMAGYILSNAAEDNEHDNGYTGPDYVAPGASGFINDMWPQNFQQGDVILSPYTYGGTWMVTTASNPSGMGAAYHNSLMAFRTANNNSTSIGNTNEVDFNIQVPYTEDSFGSYSNGLWLELCISLAGGSYFVRQINLSQYLTP